MGHRWFEKKRITLADVSQGLLSFCAAQTLLVTSILVFLSWLRPKASLRLTLDTQFLQFDERQMWGQVAQASWLMLSHTDYRFEFIRYCICACINAHIQGKHGILEVIVTTVVPRHSSLFSWLRR